jgi:hypothetical protein
VNVAELDITTAAVDEALENRMKDFGSLRNWIRIVKRELKADLMAIQLHFILVAVDIHSWCRSSGSFRHGQLFQRRFCTRTCVANFLNGFCCSPERVGTTQGSLPSDEDPIDGGDLDNGSLGSSGDPNLYCSISDEESSNNESIDDEEGNESNTSPTLTEEDNKSNEVDSDNASPALIEEDDASAADGNDRLESSSNQVEDAQENQVRRSTRICTRRG